MSRAAVKAKQQKLTFAERIDLWQEKIEYEASLLQIALICDNCHQPVVVASRKSVCCNCGHEYGTFFAYPTTALAEYLSVN